jgi:hypothetical protein
MQYTRNKTLLPRTPAGLRRAARVPYRELPARDLLLFDRTVSSFFFEFEPGQDIERFLQHSHFGGMVGGKLVACREDLLEVAAFAADEPVPLAVDLVSELPAPLRFTPDRAGFESIGRGGEFRGQVTVCSCGIAGCFSQYAWVRDSLCLALFTIDGASLTEVAWRPFRFVVQAEQNAAADRAGITVFHGSNPLSRPGC